MLYTLLKFLGWGALLAFIGGCIGWALRSLKCRGELALARTSTVDGDEVERMRHRLANLEQVVAERDRLRIQLADVRHADSPGIVGAEVPDAPPADAPAESEPEQPDPETGANAADETEPEETVEDESSSIVPESDADDIASTAGFASSGVDESSADESIADESTPDEADVEDGVELDLDAAADALGRRIELDDLTVVEGIGPKISELCSGIGITTWRQLADSDVAELQSMLDAAGSRYTVHKPGTWPRQAELLATGRWADFTSLTDELEGGK